MKFPHSLRSGERNGAERRFWVGVRHHYLGTGCGLALSADFKAKRHSVGAPERALRDIIGAGLFPRFQSDQAVIG